MQQYYINKLSCYISAGREQLISHMHLGSKLVVNQLHVSGCLIHAKANHRCAILEHKMWLEVAYYNIIICLKLGVILSKL